MSGEVLGAHVRLDLDEAAPHTTAVHLSDQHLAKQVARDGHGAAVEKTGLEDLARGYSVRDCAQPPASPSLLRPACRRRLST